MKRDEWWECEGALPTMCGFKLLFSAAGPEVCNQQALRCVRESFRCDEPRCFVSERFVAEEKERRVAQISIRSRSLENYSERARSAARTPSPSVSFHPKPGTRIPWAIAKQ